MRHCLHHAALVRPLDVRLCRLPPQLLPVLKLLQLGVQLLGLELELLLQEVLLLLLPPQSLLQEVLLLLLHPQSQLQPSQLLQRHPLCLAPHSPLPYHPPAHHPFQTEPPLVALPSQTRLQTDSLSSLQLSLRVAL